MSDCPPGCRVNFNINRNIFYDIKGNEMGEGSQILFTYLVEK